MTAEQLLQWVAGKEWRLPSRPNYFLNRHWTRTSTLHLLWLGLNIAALKMWLRDGQQIIRWISSRDHTAEFHLVSGKMLPLNRNQLGRNRQGWLQDKLTCRQILSSNQGPWQLTQELAGLLSTGELSYRQQLAHRWQKSSWKRNLMKACYWLKIKKSMSRINKVFCQVTLKAKTLKLWRSYTKSKKWTKPKKIRTSWVKWTKWIALT